MGNVSSSHWGGYIIRINLEQPIPLMDGASAFSMGALPSGWSVSVSIFAGGCDDGPSSCISAATSRTDNPVLEGSLRLSAGLEPQMELCLTVHETEEVKEQLFVYLNAPIED